jgi:heme exporter protein D
MHDNRDEPRTPQPPTNGILMAAETLRSTALAGTPVTPAKGEERFSVFWRAFGATLLSIAALVVITLCQHFSSSLTELRSDLGHLNQELRKDMARLSESHGHLVQKEEFSTRIMSVWNSIKELQMLSSTVAALKEKALVRDEQLRHQEERRELVRDLQRLRERLATLEGRQEAAPAGKSPVMPSGDSLP